MFFLNLQKPKTVNGLDEGFRRHAAREREEGEMRKPRGRHEGLRVGNKSWRTTIRGRGSLTLSLFSFKRLMLECCASYIV